MKKLGIFLMSVMALAFTSCDDYSFDNPKAQSNEQENLLLTENVSKAITVGTDLASGTTDLNALKEDANGVNVINFGEVVDFPAGYSYNVVMELSLTEDFAKKSELKVNMNEANKGYVTADAWDAVHKANFSKSPKAKATYYRFIISLVKGTETVMIGAPGAYYATGSTSVTPYAGDLVIEDAYYLLGTINGWSVATAIKFDHTGDAYDNPVFTIKVELSDDEAAAGWWWKIVPQSTYETGNWVDAPNSQYGVAENGDEAVEGMLVTKTATFEPGAGCLKTPGQLLLTINLEEGTYAFTSAVDYLYTPGDANGWNQGASQLLRTANYADYEGYAVLSPNGFKFSNAPDWNHTNYGFDKDNEGMLSTDSGAGNLSVDALGLFYCKVNTSALTYSLYAVNSIGLIGDATPGGWDESSALTPSADFLTWTGDVTLAGSGEFKFRANNAWDVDLGGSLDNLTQGGSNIATPGEGTYTVTLDLSKLPYTATVVKK